MASCKPTQKGLTSFMKQMLDQSMLRKGTQRLLQWTTQKTTAMTLTYQKWLNYGDVEVLLVLGCLTLPLMYYATVESLAALMGEYLIVVRVDGLFTLLWILAFPLLLSLPPSLSDSDQENY